MKKVFSIFQKGLQKTATSIGRSFSEAFTDAKRWDDDVYEELEASLIAADFGVKIAMRIVEDIRDRYERGLIKTSEDIIKVAKEDIGSILSKNSREINIEDGKLTVILLVGVNGSGKTTTAGKLAHMWKQDGKQIALAACDTFRAAAVQQLQLWGDRIGVHVVSAKHGADPSSVAYDAVQSALAKKADILMIDTAGRQHTKKGLMDELNKMERIIDKVYPGSPQEVWLTIDASVGGNALVQAQEFAKTVNVSGLIITKLDGTGKGGMAVAIQEDFHLPVFFVGLGEQAEDLQPFDPEYYADALFSEPLISED